MDSLSISDYEKLLNNINVNTAIEYESKIDLVKGEVKITDKKNITINSNSYRKRDKIYINNKWIDTKPKFIDFSYNFPKPKSYHTRLFKQKYINYFDVNLVVYKAPRLDIVLIDKIIYNYLFYNYF